jgi:PelA/Pel-15E family pectate lyase
MRLLYPLLLLVSTFHITVGRSASNDHALMSHTQEVKTDSIAEKILIAQRTSGGWPKHIKDVAFGYDNKWDDTFIKLVKSGFNTSDATIDNNATSREIRLLVKSFQRTKNKTYLQAAESGIRYLLSMQYQNGGFPQFFPDTSGYRKHITYNDNAMVNALRILKDASIGTNGFDVVNRELKKSSVSAVEKGIDCILKTQIRVNGKLTVWCAQHDHLSYLPAKARAYELPSFSGSESVDITRFLMEVENPSQEIKDAINGSVNWLRSATITGINIRKLVDASQPKGRDVIVVPESGSRLWARFYDLDTGKPFFCGRDGIKKANLSEIENERRVGYAYYGVWPEKLMNEDFPNWLSKNR